MNSRRLALAPWCSNRATTRLGVSMQFLSMSIISSNAALTVSCLTRNDSATTCVFIPLSTMSAMVSLSISGRL